MEVKNSSSQQQQQQFKTHLIRIKEVKSVHINGTSMFNLSHLKQMLNI